MTASSTASAARASQMDFDSTPLSTPEGKIQRFYKFAKKEATFFRVHLLAFAIVPLIFSGIFYACNGRFSVSYLDSLFLCYSAMTVTGLSTINLSTTTAMQQALLFFLMMIGDITMVSWVMVLVRKHYFRTHCEYVASLRRPKRRGALLSLQRTRTMLLNSISSPKVTQVATDAEKEITDSPFSIGNSTGLPNTTDVVIVTEPSPRPTGLTSFGFGNVSNEGERRSAEIDRIMSDDARTFTSSPKAASVALSPPSPTSPDAPGFPRTISFSSAVRPGLPRGGSRYMPRKGMTMLTSNQPVFPPLDDPSGKHVAKYKAHGGFPGPVNLAQRALKHIAPTAYRKLERSLTLPYTTTLNGSPAPLVSSPVVSSPLPRHDSPLNGELVGEEETPMEKFIADINTKLVTWLSFPLRVGRNSYFRVDELTDEQVEEIGGAEYRALRVLSYLVPCYFVLTQVFAYILFAPWISVTHTYDGVFEAQPRIIQKPWFGLFQVMGAYTGGGLSLVDMGMVPFQSAYLMIFALMFVILAGNHALPIFLRFVIWIGYKITPITSETHKAMEFLIDHPRRCFIYLFPSHQTWFLLICLVAFSAVEWAAFEVLNIGLPAFETISQGPRVLAGLFQGLAARASGFSIVPIANLAPAIQFLYAVMMYIAVYPVAMSIHATNVYEERSLGVFEAPPPDEDEEPGDLENLPSRERVGKYLDWHLRRQISNDIWWLVWAVLAIAVIERRNIMDEDKKWFDLFRVLFELVSAFGGIGLTLGVPYDNFSFCGAMRPLSKLVIIVIMVRGRHRGLPLAVDRAVLLPTELNRPKQVPNADANHSPAPPQTGDQPIPTPTDAPASGAKPLVDTVTA
ncbi:TrkH-domain-containing protein [Pleurotus eryngii]|uniref:TrkH-domain-containing protein n=1 Tax=Pleurotus eryngii TaxID=5323 RepID=A0A9P6ACF2_PLEER|nr:TrkH-domain-containing protein [Pleurotus eryngii]